MIITPGVQIGGGVILNGPAVPVPTAYFFAVCSLSGIGFDIQTTTSYTVPAGFTLITGATWDPSYNGTGNNLSNANLSLRSASGNNTTVTTYQIQTGDKVFMSFKLVNNIPSPDQVILGIAKRTMAGSAGQWPGANGVIPNDYSAGIYDDGRTLIVTAGGAAEDFNAATRRARIVTSGDVMDVAVDQANKKMWFRVNGNPWMSTYAAPTVSVGADPATNAGGFDITGIGI
jgi:hypothetical protein